MNQSDAQLVYEFTKESSGVDLPDRPQLMNSEEVHFIIKMVFDEMMELYATVADPVEAKYAMIKMITDSKDIPKETCTGPELIGAQADALIDAYYYSLNCAAKKGVNLSKVFQIVHGANMAKRDPATGKFLRRDDGKVIKPQGWVGPDITAEIERQTKEGAF